MSPRERDEPADTGPVLALAPVTQRNWQHCIHLQLAPDQTHRLASNLYSLAEAYVEPRCTPRAIYADAQMIGFVMYEFYEHSGAFSIPRFMIDVRWQGYGYGRRAMRLIVDTLKSERPDAPILISLTPDNIAARRLYEAVGFEDTGRHSHGEDVLRHP
ncbi:GNAT family N-acetyltransferase [Salinisphaera sp. T31B1]|uniref:GNAT family N-acetyltransferase n=1 Tax=Salinisphaera sp. T31B1 TaxID=727963 RepID=UPI0033413BF6